MNNRGTTLVELLMAAAILGIVSLVGLAVSQNFREATHRVDSKVKQVQLQKDLLEAVSDQKFCPNALSQARIDSMDEAEIRVRLKNDLWVSRQSADNRPAGYQTQVTSLTLADKVLSSTLDSGDRIFTAQLRLGTQALIDKVIYKAVPIASLNLQVNPANQIVSCGSNAPTVIVQDLTCDSLGGVSLGANDCRAPVAALSVTCPPGEYLQGFNTENMKVCRTVPPRTPVCTEEETMHGMGQGSTPRLFGAMGCTYSCTVPFGDSAYCGGGCFSGYRGWLYCPDCRTKTTVCR